MTYRTIFDVKTASASLSAIFDFSSNLAINETLSSASVAAVVYSGADANPTTLINGATTVAAGKATQLLSNGTLGVVYSLTCTAITSLGQTLQRQGFLTIVP